MAVNFAPAPVASAPIGGNLIDEDLDYRKKMAQQLMQAGMSAEPIQHWTQGAARMAQSLVGAMWQHKAAQREKELNDQAEKDMMGLLHPQSVTGAGMPPVPPEATQPQPDNLMQTNPQDMAALSGMLPKQPDRMAFASPQFQDAVNPRQRMAVALGAPASIRNNNPGAMYPGPSASAFGSTGQQTIGGGHKIASFPDPESGASAQFDLLRRNYVGMPLNAAIAKWSGGNSSPAYAAAIAQATGLPPDTVLTPQILSDPRVAVPMAKAMAKWEAGRDFPLDDQGWDRALSRVAGGQQPQGQQVQVADASGGFDRETLARMYRNPQTRDMATKIIISEAEARRKAAQPMSEMDRADLEYKRAQTAALQAKDTNEFAQRQKQAEQLGIGPDDPAYKSYVLTGKLPREDQQPLTATDKKAILEADDKVATNQNVLNALGEAERLNPQAYSGVGAKTRAWLGNNLPDLAVPDFIASPEASAATSDLDNAIMGQALTQLKAIFGGNPTEGERGILLEMQGSSNKPQEVRQRIFARARELANARMAMNQREADQLRGGTYYKPGGGSSGGPINTGPAPAGTPRAEGSKTINGKTYVKVNGQWYEQ